MRFNNGSYNNERRVCISNNFDTLAMKTLFVFFFFLMLSPYYSRAQVISHKFELGKGVFLMDGNPFVVKAAELHYPRIPKLTGNTGLKCVKLWV